MYVYIHTYVRIFEDNSTYRVCTVKEKKNCQGNQEKNRQEECILICPTHSRNYKYMYTGTFI